MNNEPVAWMFQGAFDISNDVSFEKPNPDIYPNPIPLYTHPVKELTDEELFNVYADLEEVYTGNNFPVDLGRAILRKAQEK
jgi:hypothetical protein